MADRTEDVVDRVLEAARRSYGDWVHEAELIGFNKTYDEDLGRSVKTESVLDKGTAILYSGHPTRDGRFGDYTHGFKTRRFILLKFTVVPEVNQVLNVPGKLRGTTNAVYNHGLSSHIYDVLVESELD